MAAAGDVISETQPSDDEKRLMQMAHEANVRGDAVTALRLFKECYQKTERLEARISVRSSFPVMGVPRLPRMPSRRLPTCASS